MNTETPPGLEHGGHDGDDGDDETVTMPCLHCVLSEALDDWMEEFKEKVGHAPSFTIIGQSLGALIEDVSQEVRDQYGQEGVQQLRDACTDGQAYQREINAQTKAAEAAASPAGETRH